MILRDLPRTHLDRLAPALLADHTLIILVSATADGDWAVAAAWDVARAAAADRRVALVDLQLEHPSLDARADDVSAEGIVDAFEFGVSLTHVARQQTPASLHFIPVGTAPSSPAAVWGNPRWERLRRGFATEGALLLAYAPAYALPQLATRPDGILVLAPRGYDPETQPLPALERAGVAILGVVRDSPQPSAPPSTTIERRSSTGDRWPLMPDRVWTAHLGRRTTDDRLRLRHAWQRRAVLAGAVALVVVVTFALRSPSAERRAPSTATDETVDADAPSAERRAPSAEGRRPTSPRADTLFYSAQVAAFSNLEQAMSHAAGLDESHRPAIVTPVAVGRNATVWYRVLVGALETADAAQALLGDLWNGGDAVRGQGTILRTPQALQVSLHDNPDDARNSARALRARGVPAYIVAGADGRTHVLVGAFEVPEQAGLVQGLLDESGVTGSLVTRTGLSITR